jgi:hypothetical protein
MTPQWGQKPRVRAFCHRRKKRSSSLSASTRFLPLDDCLYALQATIPQLTRSSLHRCLKRHGISRLPEIAGDKPAKKPFKRYPIGYFHIDIAEVRTEEGKLYLFVAIDRTSKFAFAQLHKAANVKNAVGFLRALIEAVPYKIHTLLNRQRRAVRRPALNPWTNGQVERMNRTLKEATVRATTTRLIGS